MALQTQTPTSTAAIRDNQNLPVALIRNSFFRLERVS
jgi:hypothetical protein